jgi:hypothetical protein
MAEVKKKEVKKEPEAKVEPTPVVEKEPESLLELEYDRPSLSQILFVVERFLENKLKRYKAFLRKYLKAEKISHQLYNRNLHDARLKNDEWLKFIRSRFSPEGKVTTGL